ncbi:glycosyltransferase [Entomohabitans teleogrylli]|uniref:glycosyltransferase n=1 Tax=Entomohabitans teleogrylli TaxID=1384589 RepID=UPI002012CE4F|nr:glycosyltransferase [Entomohabitans teleogrylli]
MDVPVGYGGMERVTSRVIRLLNSADGVEASVFLFDEGEEQDRQWLNGIPYKIHKSLIGNHKLRRIAHASALARYIAKVKPDIIITLNTIPCLISRLAIRFSLRNIKLLSWIHLPPLDRYRPYYLMKADYHLAISNEIRRQLMELGAAENDIATVFNPVAHSDAWTEKAPSARFIYIGRVHFEDQKRLKDLLSACALLNGEWHLDVIGDGPDREQCQAYAVACGVSQNITWHRWQRDPWQYVRENVGNVSALLLTSAHEGFPLILLEALSRGIWCISSDCVSGPGEIIQPGLNGELFPPRDTTALARKMQEIIDGRQLSSPAVIQESVVRFYEENYLAHLLSVLNAFTGNVVRQK